MNLSLKPLARRVIEPDRSQTTPEQEAVLERLIGARGKLLMPYKIWVHSAGVASGLEELGSYLNTRATLSKAELELVIIMVAVHWGSPFVLNNHERHARNAGLTDQLVDAVLAREPIVLEEPRLAAIAELTEAGLSNGGAVDDETFARFEEVLGREAIAEAVALIGYYTAVAIGMRLHEVWPDDA